MGREKIPTQDKLIAVEDGESDSDKKVTVVDELNKLGYEDLILSINGESMVGRVAYNLVKNCKTPDFLKATANKLGID